MTIQSLYSIRTSAPAILPPKVEDNPAKAKPWFVCDAFGNAFAGMYQDQIRLLMAKTAHKEQQRRDQIDRKNGVPDPKKAHLTDAQKEAARGRARASQLAARNARDNAICDFLIFERGRKVQEIMEHFSITHNAAQKALTRLRRDERVLFRFDGRNAFWRAK